MPKPAAYEKIKEQVDAYWSGHPGEYVRLELTIDNTAMSIGRAYTVTRNALNRLTREGKCERKMLAGFYVYKFTRPVEEP